jgi:predicted metal-dependent hydrolase
MLEREQRRWIDFMRKHHSPQYTLALTASAEHMTAIMAHSFFGRKEVFAAADARMRALYTWHAMEEVEHKAVAFDVMQKAAGVGYVRRVVAMMMNSIFFPLHTFLIMRYMLKVDGFSRWERTKMWAKGLWWLYKPGGLFSPVLGHYLQYYKPGFHPWQEGETALYRVWLSVFNRTRDPVAAGEAVHAAGA